MIFKQRFMTSDIWRELARKEGKEKNKKGEKRGR